MESGRLLECLDADYRRLRELADGDLTTPVPSCPGWTMTDLLRHVTEVYLHKVQCIRLGRAPEPWPPDLSAQDPREAIANAYVDLVGAFEAHDPSDHAFTWYDHDQTVGFWIRRMAQETVIHRRDAELAFDEPTPAPADLAMDGIDELLTIFVGWGTTNWAHVLVDELAPRDGDAVAVGDWMLRHSMAGIAVERGAGDADVSVSGDPSALLFWLWNRSASVDPPVVVTGHEDIAARFRETLTLSTQ